MPKDVLEEIDVNDSSKTNSLSKNSSSDKSMDKTTKSQTNCNNNGNSDSNGNSNNSNDNGKSGNSNSNSGSNEENNLSSRSLPDKNFIRKKSEQIELAKNLTAKNNHSYHEKWNNLIKIETLNMNKFEKLEEINNNNEIINEKDENKNICKNSNKFNTEINFEQKY